MSRSFYSFVIWSIFWIIVISTVLIHDGNGIFLSHYLDELSSNRIYSYFNQLDIDFIYQTAEHIKSAIAAIAPSLIIIFIIFIFMYVCFIAYESYSHDKKEYNQAILDFRWADNMSAADFESHCADYLKLKGWDAWTTKASGDQGADVIARFHGIVIAVQCKKWNKSIGNKAVQEVYAAQSYYGAHFGLVVSNQSYTKAARELAESNGVLLLHFTDLRNINHLIKLDIA